MKHCPFCAKAPSATKGLVTCHECGISLSPINWENQRDVIHLIDGIEWSTTGHVIKMTEQMPRRLAVTRSEMLSMMERSDWQEVEPAGYRKSPGVGFVHRYFLGDTVIMVSAKLEDGFGSEVADSDWEEDGAYPLSIDDMTVSASPLHGGYVLRYCDQNGDPRLFLMSLRPDVGEKL